MAVRSDEQLKDAVQNGINLLNEKAGPDWPKKVDLNDFSTFSPVSCVLCQVYGTFIAGLKAVFGSDDRVSAADEAANNGFMVAREEAPIVYRVLDTHWQDYIRAQQQQPA